MLEILRFNWKPSLIRLLLAAAADAGPVPANVWARRTGLPRNHLLASLREAEKLQALAVEMRPEGLRLLVLPVEMWRERPECDAMEFAHAWGRTVEQMRLALVTEAPSLHDALAVAPKSGVESPLSKVSPKSGEAAPNFGEAAPDSGGIDRISESSERTETFRRNTFQAENVPTCKRNVGGAESGDIGDGLRRRVEEFVGPTDWRKFWMHERYQEIFDDPIRASVLAGSLRYLQAGMKTGVVRVRTNAGRALWEDYGRCLRKRLAKI
jgi:hypothetical protein